ncbi:MAG: Rab family GTPase [Promethearchaeota archaeon]|jgi:small GTP-binding protein
MLKEIIKAIVYTSMDERLGPNPLLWFPLDLPEDIRMGVSIKTITMLTTDQGNIPNSLVIMPFPSFGQKGLVKYIEREDLSRRGGLALSSITILFDEADDLIFYKYMDYIEPAFSEYAQKIIELENQKVKSVELYAEINNLRKKLTEILDDLQIKEKSSVEGEAFPEQERKDEIRGINYKVIVCGDPSVGKTSTILRITDNAFIRTYIPTLGVSISEKQIKITDENVNLIFWDIAGQSKFEVMRRHFYQGAEGIIVIFDLTNRKSFESVSEWYRDIKKHLEIYQKTIVGFILGNKEDLVNERKVPAEEAKKVAKSLNIEYIETSAKTGKNLEKIFYRIADSLVKLKKKKMIQKLR